MRSFVLRQGRMTRAQQAALDELLPVHGVSCEQIRLHGAGVFPRRAPLHLEIGIGNGENLVQMAARNPRGNWLGCEVHRPGLGHALLELRRAGLRNLRLVEGDALELLSALPRASLAAVYIFFPDPWPKKRHQKRRLVQAALLDLLADRVQIAGRVYFASDDADYAQAVRDAIDASPRWINVAGMGSWAPRPHCRVPTRFEQRARKAGRQVYELAFAPLY